jgi:hypothetical protein
MKERLVAEAGGKCINPGCATRLLELHHIREWAIYQTHDEKHMIALCPSCHEAVTRGDLRIDDETLYRWKNIIRGPGQAEGHLYVEPGGPARLLIGSVAVQADSDLAVFRLTDEQNLSFRVRDHDIMHLNATVTNVRGDPLLEVVDNHVFDKSNGVVEVAQRPGKFRMTAAVDTKLLPLWSLRQMRVQEPDFPRGGSLTLLDLEVVEPNLVKVQGVWIRHARGVIITDSRISFLDPERRAPVSIIGEGASSILKWSGPISAALFSL